MSDSYPRDLVVHRRVDAAFRRALGVRVVLGADLDEPRVLRGTGALLWDLTSEPVRFSDLVDDLADGFRVDRGDIEPDVRAALEELVQIGAVSFEDPPTAVSP